ncbi:MAG: PLP-dependent aminotransferase family protein [Rhizobiaceae bacterium]|nr:PLP-dependent aminotransferase family protein [Rhizobiaceae bacterium]MCV0408850.1 PLP-dependent aminotransferase family protein [Rhizobiaceae bacterium]
MTNWLPDIGKGDGPLYVRLADRIERDIETGALAPGTKLPPQRNLAFDIGVTVGTVGRAYAIVRERGLVNGEVGRGTFVRNGDAADVTATPSPSYAGTRVAEAAPDRLRMDSTAAPEIGQSAVIGPLAERIARINPFEVVDYTRMKPEHWREAGRRWLAVGDWSPQPSTIVPTLGVHAAVMAIIGAVTQPGDRIVFDRLTYSSLARAAALVGRRAVVVGNDDQGTDPDDLDRICAQQHPKLAFLIPSLQNPTLSVMPEDRRVRTAEVARRHNLWIVEDAIYGVMLDEQPPALASLAPERTFHVGGLSKAVAAGVRGGWAACPANLAVRVQNAHKMMTGGMPFMLAELSAQLVLTGQADVMMDKVKAEVAAREAVAREIFAGLDFVSHPRAPFLWMKLPDPWLSATFKQAAANEGVLIDDEDEYKPVRTDSIYHRIRVGFSSVRLREDVRTGFSVLRRLLDSGGAGYDSYG